MRTAALTLVTFVAFGYAAEAQKFSLLPQVGFENSKSNISYNDLSSFSPAGVIFTPQVSLQFIYRSKPGHGFFLGAASSRSVVPFTFTTPEGAMSNYTTNTGKIQLRLEGGYQFSSKPFYLKKGSTSSKTVAVKTTERKTCGSYTWRSHCIKNKLADKSSHITPSGQTAKFNQGSWVRLQPSIGMGYIPVIKEDLVIKNQNGANLYEYRAGNFSTALLAGMGFEFGKNNTRQFTISVNYFKGIGNLQTQNISSLNGTKTITTRLQSEVSGWNVRVGVPFTLGCKQTANKQEPQKDQPQKQGCRQYRAMYKCNRFI